MAFVPPSSSSGWVPPPVSSGVPIDHSSTKSSPFLLHNADNAGILLVYTPFTEDNYNSWSHFMLMALSAKNKIGFIDGTLTKLSNATNAEFRILDSLQWFGCIMDYEFHLEGACKFSYLHDHIWRYMAGFERQIFTEKWSKDFLVAEVSFHSHSRQHACMSIFY